MRILTLASREMAERKLVWAAAAWTSLVAALLPWLRHFTGQAWEDIAAAVTVSMVLGLTLVLAAALGAAMIPGDLANRKLGFFLARPVTTAELLVGRFLGAWLLAALGGAVVALPQMALHPKDALALAALSGIAALAAVPVLLLFHALGLVWRARSPRVLLDLALVGGFTAGMAWLTRRLLAAGAFPALGWLFGGAALLVTLLLAVAAYLALDLGRADLQRNHRIQTLTLATGLLAVILAGLGFTAWIGASGPGTLTSYHVENLAPQGDWAFLTGTGRMHPQSFLLDTATGETVPWHGDGQFSRDGRHFIGTQVTPSDPGFRMVEVDLAATPAKVSVKGTFPLGGDWSVLWLRDVSPQGRYAAVMLGNRTQVLDLATGRKVSEEVVPKGSPFARQAFVSEQAFRTYRPLEAGGTEIRELDLGTGQWSITGRIQAPGVLRLTPACGQALVIEGRDVLVCDGRSGTVTGRLSPSAGGTLDAWPQPRWDGTFAAVETRTEGALLHVFDATGRDLWTRPLDGPKGSRFLVCPEPGTARIYVDALPSAAAVETMAGRLLVADVAARTLAPAQGSGLVPTGGWNLERPALACRLRVTDHGMNLMRPDGTFRPVVRNARWTANPEP